MKKDVKTVVILVLAVLIAGGIGYYCAMNKSTNTKNNDIAQIDDNINQTGIRVEQASISFANMKIDNPNLKLTEEQKEVLKYFDNDYFRIYDYSNLQRYPKIYKGAQVKIGGQVKKVIKSTDTEYELLVNFNTIHHSAGTDYMLPEEINPDELFVIKGDQTDKRLIVGDSIYIYGRYNSVDTYEIDGTSYTLPTINVFNVCALGEDRFSLETITKVAKNIFGNDIKIKNAVAGVDYIANIPEVYVVTLDNQSNENFKSFGFYRDKGGIFDARDLTDTPITAFRDIYVTADLQHYIITVYEISTEQMYLEYYDRDFKKLWSREFSNVDILHFPMDYTSEHIMCVADNDLYLIDSSTGEDLIDPKFVGEKITVRLIEDGAILMNSDPKDSIMKVDLKGNIVWKVSTKLGAGGSMQIVDGNFVIGSIVLDKDGNIVLEQD